MKAGSNTYKYMLLDAVLINLSIITAYYLRFGRNLDMTYFEVYLQMAAFVTVGKIAIFYYFGLYNTLWKYADIDDMVKLVWPIGIANALVIVAIYFLSLKVPRSIYAIATFVDVCLIAFSRYGIRIFSTFINGELIRIKSPKGKRVLIVGAGEAAGLLIQEAKKNSMSKLFPVCAVDDNKKKIGKKIIGVPIVGDRYDIPAIVEAKQIEEIIIAIPSIKTEELREIIEQCKKANVLIKILPSIGELREYDKDVDKVLIKKIRKVDINDLLGRKEIKIDVKQISNYLKDKRVLITGGAGSIGSELCRQILLFNPSALAILDTSEENVYRLMEDLKYQYRHDKDNVSKIDKIVKIYMGSIRDKKRVNEVFSEIKPDIVFHSAAHKHVHLMETNPQEAIKNNIFGTLNVIQASQENDVERFILISTDKAVNPTNVYGATKRICEMLIQGFSKNSKTEFSAVRFGNVLESKGSVIPLFREQIQRGGPVTVTHPEVTRFFMTISEAVQLVIQAGSIAKGGEIFILDMGEPVKIDNLAREMIKLSGYEPDIDIKIEYIGLRPGEKLYEELLLAEEGLQNTEHEKIFKARPVDIDITRLLEDIECLPDLNGEQLKQKLKAIVPTYQEQEQKSHGSGES